MQCVKIFKKLPKVIRQKDWHLGYKEAFGEQHDFTYLLQVGHNDNHRTKKGFHGLRQLRAARVPRIHGDENAHSTVYINLCAFKLTKRVRVVTGVAAGVVAGVAAVVVVIGVVVVAATVRLRRNYLQGVSGAVSRPRTVFNHDQLYRRLVLASTTLRPSYPNPTWLWPTYSKPWSCESCG